MTRKATYPAIITLVGLVALAAPDANAGIKYTYTGHDFTNAQSPYTTSDSITGDFILANPLTPDLVNQSISPSAWVFNDGLQTVTNQNVIGTPTFAVYTNSAAAITGWVFLVPAPSGGFIQTVNVTTSSSVADNAAYTSGLNQSFAAVASDPGVWTSSVADSSVPEPSSAALFVTAVLGLAGLGRRWKRIDPGE